LGFDKNGGCDEAGSGAVSWAISERLKLEVYGREKKWKGRD
jgi:hypothetical protein